MKQAFILISVFILLISCVTEDLNKTEEVVINDSPQIDAENSSAIEKGLLYDEATEELSVQTPEIVIVEKHVYLPAAADEEPGGAEYNEINKPDPLNQGEQKWSYIPSQAYMVCTSPLIGTDIRLEPGEKLIGAPIMGDTTRWEIIGAISVEKGIEVSHVVVKPHTEGLKTTLMLTTDRRTYNLVLLSSRNDYNLMVSWNYPFDRDLSAITLNPRGTQNNAAADSGTERMYLSFDYQIKRGQKRPFWTPERVYDNGRKTFIEFPEGALNREIPIAIGDNGEQLNTRLDKNTLIIDKLLIEITLINGKEKIKIEKKKKGN